MATNVIGDLNLPAARNRGSHLSLDAEFFPGMTKK
jgi:hypothetical protein